MARRRTNPVARSPLLRKGGVHQKSKSAKRFKDKQALRAQTSSYWNNNEGRGPRFFSPGFGSLPRLLRRSRLQVWPVAGLG